jgi:hypothetical protein
VTELCPECGSDNLDEGFEPKHITDGQGYAWSYIYDYTCNDCGCEFGVTLATTRRVEVEKHGSEWIE